MKKLLSILCALSILALPFNVYAEEVLGPGQADSTLTYHVDSQFSVIIPETIDVTNDAYYFSSGMMDLADGESVVVRITGLQNDRVTLTNANGNTVQLAINQLGDPEGRNSNVVGLFKSGYTTSSVGFSCSCIDGARAGDYSGSVTFDISLE